MKRKVQAQRKFAQGAYVPPGANGTNGTNSTVNVRIDSTNEKSKTYLFRHNTSARILLDSISFQGIHKHNPIVLLERLQDRPVMQMNEANDVSNGLLTTADNNVTTKAQEQGGPMKAPSLSNSKQNNASDICTKPRNENKIKKRISKRKLQKKHQRCNMTLRSSTTNSSFETDFSIDDDKPLMFYTKKIFKHKSNIMGANKNKILETKKDLLIPLQTTCNNTESHNNAVPSCSKVSFENKPEQISSPNVIQKRDETVENENTKIRKVTPERNEEPSSKKAYSCVFLTRPMPLSKKRLNSKVAKKYQNESPSHKVTPNDIAKEVTDSVDDTNFEETPSIDLLIPLQTTCNNTESHNNAVPSCSKVSFENKPEQISSPNVIQKRDETVENENTKIRKVTPERNEEPSSKKEYRCVFLTRTMALSKKRLNSKVAKKYQNESPSHKVTPNDIAKEVTDSVDDTNFEETPSIDLLIPLQTTCNNTESHNNAVPSCSKVSFENKPEQISSPNVIQKRDETVENENTKIRKVTPERNEEPSSKKEYRCVFLTRTMALSKKRLNSKVAKKYQNESPSHKVTPNDIAKEVTDSVDDTNFEETPSIDLLIPLQTTCNNTESHNNAVPSCSKVSFENKPEQISSPNVIQKRDETVENENTKIRKVTPERNEEPSSKKEYRCVFLTRTMALSKKRLNSKVAKKYQNESPSHKVTPNDIAKEVTDSVDDTNFEETPSIAPVEVSRETQLALAAHLYSESNKDVSQLSTFVRSCPIASERKLRERRQSVVYQEEQVNDRKHSVACKENKVKKRRQSVSVQEELIKQRRRSTSIRHEKQVSFKKNLVETVTCQENPVGERRDSVTCQEKPVSGRTRSSSSTSFVECLNPTETTATENHAEQEETRVTKIPSNQEKEHKTYNKSKGKIIEAPAFRPTEAEFRDPVAYFQKITPEAAKYGLCKVIAPPGFKPTCTMNDTIRFVVTNQYLARFYSRWGPVTRELCALRSFLASQNIVFSHSPLMEGLEVNLPKILHFVQRQGGLKENVESRTYVDTRKWNMLADELNYNKLHNPGKKLDQIYVKYLLPYDALTQRERQELTEKMDSKWSKRNDKLIRRAQNPLHRQKRLLGESDSSDDDDSEDDQPMTAALNEAEECVVRGRVVNHANFKKIAATALNIFFPSTPSTFEIEAQYWKLVLLGNEHVCVNTASIDTGAEGLGFSKNKNDPFSKHPWNLKMLSQNPGNVLRSLGSVLGVTVPTLHVGMIYSTSCWHRDPHGLPWIEYMHTGPEKIWYGIADSESTKFRRAVENLCPSACQNKSIWLPSDIAMIPPTLLLERNVSMSRVVQKPGEYVIVFPKAYSCSISTGYTVSESVYFATSSWVKSVNYVFQELRKSCEPTMFSLEQLLIAVARDPNASLTMLQLVHESFSAILSEELDNRRLLEKHGLKPLLVDPESRSEAGDWNVHENECEVCRSSLYLSRVKGVFRKRYSVCLRHALHVLDSNNKKIIRCKKETYELEYFFSSTELEEVISSVIERLTKVT